MFTEYNDLFIVVDFLNLNYLKDFLMSKVVNTNAKVRLPTLSFADLKILVSFRLLHYSAEIFRTIKSYANIPRS